MNKMNRVLLAHGAAVGGLIAILCLVVCGCTEYKVTDVITTSSNNKSEVTTLPFGMHDALYLFNKDAEQLKLPLLTVQDVDRLEARDIMRLRLALRYRINPEIINDSRWVSHGKAGSRDE